MADVQGAMSVLLSALPSDVAASLAAGKAVPASLLPTAAPALSPADSAKVQSAVGVVLSALPGPAASSLIANYGAAQTGISGSTATTIATATDSAAISAATVVSEGSTIVTGEQTSTPPTATNTQPGGTITNSPTTSQIGPAALATGGTGAGTGHLAGGQVAGVAVGSAAAGIFLIALVLFFWRRHSKNATGKRKSSDRVFPEVAWLYDPRRTPSNGSKNAPEVHAPLMTQTNTAYQPHPISGPGTSYQPTPAMSGTATPNHFYPAATATGTGAPSSISSWRPGTTRSFEQQQYQPLNQPYSSSAQANYGTTSTADNPTARTLTASSKGTYTFIPPIPTLSSAPESDHDPDTDTEDEADLEIYHDALFSPTSGPFPQPVLPPNNATSTTGTSATLTNPFSDNPENLYEYSTASIGRVVSMHNRQPSSDYGTPLMTIREEGYNPYSLSGARGRGLGVRGQRSELGGTEVDRAELSGEGSSSGGLGISSASNSGNGSSPGQSSGESGQGVIDGRERGEVERNGSYGFGNANLSHPEANLSPISGRSLRF